MDEYTFWCGSLSVTTYATFEPSAVISGSDTVLKSMMASRVHDLVPAESQWLPNNGKAARITLQRDNCIARDCTDSTPNIQADDPLSRAGAARVENLERCVNPIGVFRPDKWTNSEKTP